jgi:hypothetical protein
MAISANFRNLYSGKSPLQSPPPKKKFTLFLYRTLLDLSTHACPKPQKRDRLILAKKPPEMANTFSPPQGILSDLKRSHAEAGFINRAGLYAKMNF